MISNLKQFPGNGTTQIIILNFAWANSQGIFRYFTNCRIYLGTFFTEFNLAITGKIREFLTLGQETFYFFTQNSVILYIKYRINAIIFPKYIRTVGLIRIGIVSCVLLQTQNRVCTLFYHIYHHLPSINHLVNHQKLTLH